MKLKALVTCGSLLASPALAEAQSIHPVEALKTCVQSRFAEFAVNNLDGTATYALNDKDSGTYSWNECFMTFSPDPARLPHEVMSSVVIAQDTLTWNQDLQWFDYPPSEASLFEFNQGLVLPVDRDEVMARYQAWVRARAAALLADCQNGELAVDEVATSSMQAWRALQSNFELAQQRLLNCQWDGDKPEIEDMYSDFADMFEDATFDEATEVVLQFQEQAQLYCPDA